MLVSVVVPNATSSHHHATSTTKSQASIAPHLQASPPPNLQSRLSWSENYVSTIITMSYLSGNSTTRSGNCDS
jgi:hypothetical protein